MTRPEPVPGNGRGDGPGGDTMPVPLLDVVDLHTHYLTERGVSRVVDGVSLRLERGRTLGVVGESGSGKTQLSRSIMGLLPTTNVVRSGHINYEGRDIIDLSHDEL